MRLGFILKAVIGTFVGMENPRTINRFFLGMLIAYAAIAIAASVFFGDVSILLYFIAAIGLILGMFGLVAILNVIVFAPIFWLMAKLTAHKPKRGSSDGRAV